MQLGLMHGCRERDSGDYGNLLVENRSAEIIERPIYCLNGMAFLVQKPRSVLKRKLAA